MKYENSKDIAVTSWLATLRGVTIASIAVVISACSGGAETQVNPVTSLAPVADYTGPAPATDDVQSFKINLWENVRGDDRCGACHGEGGQAPTFARTDDVNMAYEQANQIVDLLSPQDSRMVEKVAGGHNCWRDSDAACADNLTTWITAWSGALVAGGSRTIVLEAPTIKDPGSSKNFPADAGLFASTVHPVVTTYCAGCHASNAANPQGPYFADGDVDTAYDAAKSKIDLNNPPASRLVARLREEFHNCWDDCSANSTTMQTAIENMAGSIQPTVVDPSLTISKALTILDGVVASGGSRYEANAIATWEFKTGEGLVAFDTSGVEPAIDLTLTGDISWVGGWGITVRDGKAQGLTSTSKKLHDLIKATGEYSIEAWVVPANVSQEEARIVSYSAGPDARNFTLGQTLYNYDFANRSDVTDGNGMPALSTNDDDEDLQATLQHVVATYDPVDGRRIYVNGVYTGDADAAAGGGIADWDDTFAFVLGSEVNGAGQFQGTYRYVSVHNRVLTEAQIQQNFDAGVGEKFYLLFSVSHLVDVPDAYIVFEVSQFDNFGYLFNAPHFVSLDPAASFDGIPIQGIRIGVNGIEATVGQAYRNVDTMLSDAALTELGQPLSGLGTVLALERGPDSDEFFLTFDVLGNNVNVRTDPVPLAPPPPVDGEPAADIGIRTFEEIDATLSAITGVPRDEPNVRATYEAVRQQMPTSEAIGGFLAAHQVGIAQLAVEYCNALVEDTALRAQFFPGVDFSAAASSAFGNATSRALVIDPLINFGVGENLLSQPLRSDIESELNFLIDRLTACGNSCASDRTRTVTKAACAAVLGSATMLVQ
jgi:mono/diheme cytochrome c family protein